MNGLGLRPLVWSDVTPASGARGKQKSESLNAKGSKGVWRFLGPAWTDHHSQDSAAQLGQSSGYCRGKRCQLGQVQTVDNTEYCPIFHERGLSHARALCYLLPSHSMALSAWNGQRAALLRPPPMSINGCFGFLTFTAQPTCRFLLDPPHLGFMSMPIWWCSVEPRGTATGGMRPTMHRQLRQRGQPNIATVLYCAGRYNAMMAGPCPTEQSRAGQLRNLDQPKEPSPLHFAFANYPF